MNYFFKQNPNQNIFRIVVVFAFVLLLNGTAFGQTTEEKNPIVNATSEINIKLENASDTSNMNLLLWFMGTNQDPNNTISTNGINTKKQIMTSGMAPNRLLIKAFLKKAVNFASEVA